MLRNCLNHKSVLLSRSLFSTGFRIIFIFLMMDGFSPFLAFGMGASPLNRSCVGLWKTPSLKTQKAELENTSFDVLRTRPGQHGGRRILIQRRGGWFDMKKEIEEGIGDVVPDMKFYPYVMGPKEADFFGFKMVDKWRMEVPDGKELLGAIHLFNRDLPEGDPRRIIIFPEEVWGKSLSHIGYLENFAQSGQIPLLRQGKWFFHDLISHSMEGFFIPNSFIRIIQKRVSLLMEISDFLKKETVDPHHLEIINQMDLLLRSDLRGVVDQLGGFPFEIIPLFLRHHLGSVGLEQYRQFIRKTGHDQGNLGVYSIRSAMDYGLLPFLNFTHYEKFDEILQGKFLGDKINSLFHSYLVRTLDRIKQEEQKEHYSYQEMVQELQRVKQLIYVFLDHFEASTLESPVETIEFDQLRRQIYAINYVSSLQKNETPLSWKKIWKYLNTPLSEISQLPPEINREQWEKDLSQIEFSRPFIERLRYLREIL